MSAWVLGNRYQHLSQFSDILLAEKLINVSCSFTAYANCCWSGRWMPTGSSQEEVVHIRKQISVTFPCILKASIWQNRTPKLDFLCCVESFLFCLPLLTFKCFPQSGQFHVSDDMMRSVNPVNTRDEPLSGEWRNCILTQHPSACRVTRGSPGLVSMETRREGRGGIGWL